MVHGPFIHDFSLYLLYCDLLEYSAEDHHLVVLVEDDPGPLHLHTLVLLQTLLQLCLAGLNHVQKLGDCEP